MCLSFDTSPCKIHPENQQLTLPEKCMAQPLFLHRFQPSPLIHNSFVPKPKNPLNYFLFSVQIRTFVPSYQSRTEKRKEPRTVTNSLPVT